MSGAPPGVRVTRAGWKVADRGGAVVCVATGAVSADKETTFVQDHMARLPATVTVLSGLLRQPPRADTGARVAAGPGERIGRAALRRLLRRACGRVPATAQDAAIARHLRRLRVSVVLAEFGATADELVPACRLARLPLVAHFHGHDASAEDEIRSHSNYAEVFAFASGVVAVSRDMQAKLLELGARRETLHYNPYGVDTQLFAGADPRGCGPVFLAVGRFVEKKAPELTLLAFRLVQERIPAARLVMVGDGPLRGPLERIAGALGLSPFVTFLGGCPPEIVREQMRSARAFVQHSVRARNGDSEGTPVAILEASAVGLPVVATRHAGIKDVVVDGETGYLVDEEDVCGMAARMAELAQGPELAARLGAAARRRVEAHFSMERSIAGLWAILDATRARAARS